MTRGRGRWRLSRYHQQSHTGAALRGTPSRLTQQNCKVILLLCSVPGGLWKTCFANRAFH